MLVGPFVGPLAGGDGATGYGTIGGDRLVGLAGVAGGCVLTQTLDYLLNTSALLDLLSVGTVAYGLYGNPKGGTFGTLSRDGRTELREEIGPDIAGENAESCDELWRHRFWEWDRPDGMEGAYELAYATARAGLRVPDQGPVIGLPRRVLVLPQDLAG